MSKSVSATDFRAKCLSLIDQMEDDGESIVVTRRGKPVALLSPLPRNHPNKSLIGALKGTVLRYDDPFAPAADPADWGAMQ